MRSTRRTRIRILCAGVIGLLAPIALSPTPARAAMDGTCVSCTDEGVANCGNDTQTCPNCSSCADNWGYVHILHRKPKL